MLLTNANNTAQISAEAYFSKWKKPSYFKDRDDLEAAFAYGGNKHKLPLVTRKPIWVLPKVSSFDPRFLNFVRELSNTLSREITPHLDKETGYTTNGVYSDFAPLKTVPGWMMNPMSAIMVDNHAYRTGELKLEAKYDVVGRAIATNVWRLIFGSYKPSALKVNKNSSSGALRFTADEEWKIEFALFVFTTPNFNTVLRLVRERKWLELANEFEMIWMLYMQKRDQVDTVGKPRFVFDEEYARTGGKSGWSGNADKEVDIPGFAYNDEFSATRARNVQAAVWCVNCICSIISTGTMQAMFVNFPVLFHTTTAEQLKEALDGLEVYASDVKEYDRSMSKDALDVCFSVAREFWSDELVTVAERLMYACYYSRPLEEGGDRGFWVGNPFMDEPQVVAGNRSGHAWTSLIAKVNKVIDELIALQRMGIPILGNERLYMEQKGLVKLINNGDDNMTAGSPELISRYAKHRTSASSGHYLVSREDGCVYSGMVMMRPDLSKPVYQPVPRAGTAMQKMYVPERGVDSRMRKYWHIGFLDRLHSATSYPAGEEVWRIHNSLFTTMMEPHFGRFRDILADAAAAAPLPEGIAFTAADKLALDEPDRISWYFKDGEVNEKIVDLVSKRIPYEAFEHIVTTHYTGTLQ